MSTSPIIEITSVSYTYPEGDTPVFTDLSLELPAGTVSFVGQNGTGKSTLLLLAGGRIAPDTGTVTVLGTDMSEITDEIQRNLLVSFVYQNMEFETEESIGDLINFVHGNGALEGSSPDLVKDLISALELEDILTQKTQTVSKGEMQRTIIAFSVLYGSKIIMMDEPVFALEWEQKEKVMGFLSDYCGEAGVSALFSVHELELSKRYSEYMALFSVDGTVQIDKSEILSDRDIIEKAYEVPYGLLYQKEHLYRQHLLEAEEEFKRNLKGIEDSEE